MRHNKLAGTRFLLGSRKHKPSTFTSLGNTIDCNCGVADNNNMLHSKSTYFYRWFSEHLGLVVSGLSTKNTNKVSKVSKTNKASYLVLAVCGVALLGGLSLIINPLYSESEGAHATSLTCQTKPSTDNPAYCAMELGIMMNGTNEAFTEASATELKTDATAYREYNFAVRAVDTEDGYKLLAEAVNTTVGGKDYTNQLVNMDDPDNSKLVPLAAATTGASIPSGQWGYAFAKGDDIATTDKTALEYKAVPTATDTTREIDTGSDTIYDDASNTHTDMDYKLYFGARAGDNMRSGHYRTQVLLSVVADAKFIGGLGITKMSEMTSEFCGKLPEVTKATPMTDIPTSQLIDDREVDNPTKYWVAKLADGNCWMTQNIAYDVSGAITAKKSMIMKPNDVNNPTSYAEVNVADMIPSNDPAMTDVISGVVYNTHYLAGNYYTINGSQAANACDFTSKNADAGWILPTDQYDASTTAPNGSFGKLLGVYGTSGNTLRVAPLYYVFSGMYFSNGSINAFGSNGWYWSSTFGTTGRYNSLNVTSGGASSKNWSSPDSWLTVRCVVPVS